ncbi:MAG: hypothetical protein F4X95_00335 [Oligoflexia bacterium]|nr:hypothetical protein [Oligoflexia bacterium]
MREKIDHRKKAKWTDIKNILREYNRMIYKIKRQVRTAFKIALHIIISTQLCYMPYYTYSNQNGKSQSNALENIQSDASIKNILDQMRKKMSLEDPETIQRMEGIIGLAEAIETGKTEEYLHNHPHTRQDRDYFLLSDQKVESIEHHFDFDKGTVVDRVVQTVELNSIRSTPVHTIVKNVHVKFDAKTKELVFEGIVADAVILRQRIPNMDIIDYVNDKETLILLDRKRGLLLVDMFFAKAYLGIAPIPVTRIPVPVLESLTKVTSSSEINRDNISLEFINRSIRPPDIMPKAIQNIDRNFDGNALFAAGDFMLSYTDQDGQKRLIQFLKRAEIAGWLKLNYDILDIMTKVIAPHLMELDDIKLFSKEMKQLKTTNPVGTLDHTLSALFTKNALHKLNQAAQGIQQRVSQLQSLSPTDTMLFEEWKESFNKISHRLKGQNVNDQKVTGNVLRTEQISGLYQEGEGPHSVSETQKQKHTRAVAIRIMAGIISTSGKTLKWMDKHRVSTGLAASGLLGFFVIPELFVMVTNIFLSITNNITYKEGLSFYEVTSIPNLITMLVFLPSIVILMSWLSIPFIKQLQKMVPKNISIMGKVYHPKGSMEDIIKKWEDTNVSQRIVGMGMKFVAYTMYPFWNYLANIVGQPHFLSAVAKGLNPLKKITPESDIGQVAHIKETTRLGTQGLQPHWRENESFNQHRVLQNIAASKEHRMKSVAWLMASLAVAGRTQVEPEAILVYGATSINLDDLNRIHNDKALRSEMLWVMENLLNEIRQLDEMDIRKELVDLEPEMVVRYYERATRLANEVREQPELQKKMNEFFNTGWVHRLKQNINWHTIAGLNRTQHNMLKNVPTGFVTNRVVTEFISDHVLVSLLPLITAERVEVGLMDVSQLVTNENYLSWSGKPHLNEVWLNVIAHFFIAGGQRSLVFTEPATAIQTAQKEQMPVYEPIESYTKKSQVHPQGEWTYYKKQFSYFLSGGEKDNLGKIMLKAYIARLRTIQMTFSLMVGLRLLTTDQSFSEAALGFLLFHFAGQWVFGWPWDVISGGARLNAHYLAENKKKVEDLKLKLSKVARGLYKESRSLGLEYEAAVHEVSQLYSSKLLRAKLLNSGIKEVNPKLWIYLGNHNETPDKDSLSGSIEEMQKTSEKLVNLLAESPPLPNTDNKMANLLFTFTFGAFLTTYLFVALSVWTFSPEYLNMKTIFTWAAINYGLYGLLYFIYSKGVKGHREAMKNWPSQVRHRWERITRLNWKEYFYEGVLNLNRSVRSVCRTAFIKSTGK